MGETSLTLERPIQAAGRPVGGFFGLAIEDIPVVPGSVWDDWTAGAGAVATFGTARQALAAIIATTRPQRVWLPDYLCREMATAAAAAHDTVQTYKLARDLSPDRDFLAARLGAGDLVLVNDYFGWPPSRDFRAWAAATNGVTWVEDRAQALWLADPPWTPWRIASPRKLIGVPNGGLLLAPPGHDDIVAPANDPALDLALSELMRFEDAGESDNASWHAAYQARERALGRGASAMSRLTEALLRRIPIAPLVTARRANYDYLLHRIGDYAAWPRAADGVAPFGFVIAVEDAGALAASLAERRFFCARHWAAIGPDAARFPRAQALARHLLTLPCDQRYGPADLARLVAALRQIAPRPACI